MKQIIIMWIALAQVFFFSCGKTSCLTPDIFGVIFNSADTIPDTSASVIQYRKGSGFTNIIHSYDSVSIYRTYDAAHKEVALGTSITGVYDYDWMIILRPSGKVYQLAAISHSNNKQSNGGIDGIKDRCVNALNYTVNGVNHSYGVSRISSSSSAVSIPINY